MTYLINYLDLDSLHNEIVVNAFNELNAILKCFSHKDVWQGNICIESVVPIEEELKTCLGCKQVLSDEEIEYYGDLCFSCGDAQESQRWS